MQVYGDGHLSKSGLKKAKAIQRNLHSAFSFFEIILIRIRELTSELPAKEQHTDIGRQQLFALILLTRILEISEAALLVCKHGMSNEANSLFRVFLDAYFVFANVCSESKFIGNYLKTDDVARLKLMNSVSGSDSELFKMVNEYATESLRSELKERIARENIRAFSGYQYAVNVGCSEIYDSMYRVTSSSVHTTPRALELYVTENEDGNITQISDHPKEINIKERCYDISFFLINCIGGLSDLFPELADSDKVKLVNDLNAAHGKET